MENNTAPMKNMCMDWNDTIESDGAEFITLPEGDYAFTITGFERARFNGSAKIPACNKAVLSLGLDTPVGPVNVKTDIILYRTLEWKIASFFRCIGVKKHGEQLVMDWNRVPGAKGWCHIKPRSYTYNGRDYTANDVESFIDPENAPKQNATPDWVRDAEQQMAAQQMPPQQMPQNYRQPQLPQPYPQQYPGVQPYQPQQYVQQQMNWKDGQF